MTDIFNDGRMMLTAGEDIQMGHFRQDADTNKANLLLDEHLLCFVLHGHKTLWHPQGKLQVLPGEGFFLAKGNYLRTERCVDPVMGYQSLVVRLSDKFFLSLEDAVNRDSTGQVDNRDSTGDTPGQVFHLQEDILVKSLVTQLTQYFQAPEEKARIESLLPLKIRELMMLLLSAGANKRFDHVIRCLPTRREPSLAALMEAHFRESLSLEQWAFLAGLSLSSFKRKFEAAFHMPPGRWIQQRRLEDAYHLLGHRHMNVTEVCFTVGFENLAHFVQAFKEKYHITPKQRQMTEQSAV